MFTSNATDLRVWREISSTRLVLDSLRRICMTRGIVGHRASQRKKNLWKSFVSSYHFPIGQCCDFQLVLVAIQHPHFAQRTSDGRYHSQDLQNVVRIAFDSSSVRRCIPVEISVVTAFEKLTAITAFEGSGFSLRFFHIFLAKH